MGQIPHSIERISSLLYISRQPPLEPDNITRKPILPRIERYILHREILSTFHTRVNRRSVPWSVRHVAIQINGSEILQNAKNHARNSPFLLRHMDFHLTYECLGPPHSPRQTTARSLYTLPHKDVTKSALVTMGRRKFTPELPLPLRRSPPKSNTPVPSPTHSPPQTASGNNQPFCHNTHVQTDRCGTTWSITLALCSAILISSDALISWHFSGQRWERSDGCVM